MAVQKVGIELWATATKLITVSFVVVIDLVVLITVNIPLDL